MATEIKPSTMGITGTFTVAQTSAVKMAAYSSDCYVAPTTVATYAIRYAQEGKTGVCVAMLPASSLNCLRIYALGGQSTDGAWQSGKNSTVLYPLYQTGVAQSTLLMAPHVFMLPDSARFGVQSTVDTQQKCCLIQIEGSTAPGTTGSTTLATVATTIGLYAFAFN
jgi:hypothetical protein